MADHQDSELDHELHRVALTAIIHRQGKFLILKRSPDKKAFPGLWTVPGGGLHPDDYTATPQTFEQQWYLGVENALRREVREESGLEIGRPRFLLDIILIRPDGIRVVVLSYYAKYVSGEVKLDEDSVESAWVSYAEVKQNPAKYELIPGILGELAMVDAILHGADRDSLEYHANPS